MMATERLYFADAYLREFEATVIATARHGDHDMIALDRSAFYPEGGGQPADHGWLAGYAVDDVQADDAGVVWHRCAAAANVAVGSVVRGQIDWARRFDHMQQHLGQHLLTAAFIATAGFPTTSFHLSDQSVTIDLDTPNLTADHVAAAEAAVNAVVWEDRPVTAQFVTAEELARLPLRKPPSVSEAVRVVIVPEYDYSACGGTHPRSTGAVGMIVVRRWSRQKSGVRVEFACGGRALREFQRVNGVASRIAASLSVGIDEAEAAVARTQSTLEATQKTLRSTQEALDVATVAQLYAAASEVGGVRVVCARDLAPTPERLRGLAQGIAAQGGVAILGLASDRAHLVVACAPTTGCDARQILQAGMAILGGRGGGNLGLAQGGGPEVTQLDAALAAMRASLAAR